jgi:hypothetical protein
MMPLMIRVRSETFDLRSLFDLPPVSLPVALRPKRTSARLFAAQCHHAAGLLGLQGSSIFSPEIPDRVGHAALT